MAMVRYDDDRVDMGGCGTVIRWNFKLKRKERTKRLPSKTTPRLFEKRRHRMNGILTFEVVACRYIWKLISTLISKINV
jgi:hypothetical protein